MNKYTAGDISAIAFLTGLGLYELFIAQKFWVGFMSLAFVAFLFFLHAIKK